MSLLWNGMLGRFFTRDAARSSALVSFCALGLLVGKIQPTWASDAEFLTVEPQNTEIDPVREGLSLLPLASNSTVVTIPQLSELEQPATTIEDWLAQRSQALVQVTGVRVEVTESSLQVVLEVAEGELPTPAMRSVGNALIADFSGVTLALPNGDEFSQANPIEGIALVSVTSLPDNRVRVAITGVEAPPMADVRGEDQEFVLSVVPGTEEVGTGEDAIQVVVTGEQEGYAVPNATTATRTDTPLRDIPQSIQVIPQQVLEDQQARDLNEAVRNVSGVIPTGGAGRTRDQFIIRGFDGFDSITRDGFRENRSVLIETANIEQIEVLRGPASVLFGQLEPGGVINVITEQPLFSANYEIGLDVGSFGFVRPTFDVSGPLNQSESLRYRINGVYAYSDTFRDFDENVERYFIAPVIAWDISERTRLVADIEYLRDIRPFDRGLIAIGDEVVDIPFDRLLGEPFDFKETESWRFGVRVEHDISDNWTLRTGARIVTVETSSFVTEPNSLDEETGLLSRDFSFDGPQPDETYAFQTDIVGRFSTGSIEHQLLLGVDFNRQTSYISDRRGESAPPINIFNPTYLGRRPDIDTEPFSGLLEANNIGIYLQNQITLLDNLKILISGRYDFSDQRFLGFAQGEDFFNLNDEAFSPRVGIVYQPIAPLALYASYSRSFTQNFGVRSDNSQLEPERGTQYEIGIRGEFLEGRLITSLAAYEVTKSNIATTDPDSPNFSIPVGETRSRGIEFDIAGEILRGWNIIASYAFANAEVAEDNTPGRVGNRLAGVPEHSASVWTTYEIQQGNLQGLGFGMGLFFVGERQGDLNNSFSVPGYMRTDAALYYRRDNWRLGLNFKNLFDVNYVESVSARTRVDPGNPFTVVGSISFAF